MTDLKGLRVRAAGKIYSYWVVFVLLALAMGAGIAQSDIYLRPNDSKNGSARGTDAPKSNPTIFLKRNNKQKETRPTTNAGRVDYGGRLDLSGLRRQTLWSLNNLDAWRKADRDPQTPGEILSYANAMRAPDMARMIQERERSAAQIEKQKAARDARFERNLRLAANDPRSMDRANALLAAGKSLGAGDGRGVAAGRTAQAQQAAPAQRVRTIYRRSPTTLSKPRKVFRDYR